MRTLPLRLKNTRMELALLLLASLATVVVLTAGLTGNHEGGPAGLDAGGLLLIALLAGASLLATYLVVNALRSAQSQARGARSETNELRRTLATSDALIKAEPQVLMYWEQGQGFRIVTQSLGNVPGLPEGPAELMRFGQWLDVKSAASLKPALDRLFAEGRAFNLILRTAAGGHLEADGRAAGGRAVLRLRDIAGYKRDLSAILDQHTNLAREIRSSRALLDALPSPAWLRDQNGRITWVNQAYVKAVEAQNDAEVRTNQIELLESRQRKAAERALKPGKPYHERMPLIVGGERKSHDVIIIPLGDATAGTAIDVAALESAQGELERQIAAYDRTLDRVATAVAIFNPEQRLTFFNNAFVGLWQLDRDWLASSPTDGAILDRLRDLGRLPEVVHYRDWKEKVLSVYKAGSEREDRWHLPDGRIVHVVAEQRPDGGVTYLYEDESERLALESRYNALIGVQTETLNSLKEGVAVFGTDGRLKLFNLAFASIWKLSRRRLAEGPHIDEFIHDARVLYDDMRTWSRIGRAVTAFLDHREPMEGQMVRPDQSVIDFAMTPLPDGATLLTFVDVTDAKRYERALIERNEALVAADRLKNRFIGHVSYELRTPLTNIIGFSDLLASPHLGQLSEKQREYLDDISSSSRTLLAIIDDILDLATIDAGALELKIGMVDVRAVIHDAIAGVQDRAGRAHLTLDIAIADDATAFLADEARVRQILYNLLSNAVGFSREDGTVKLSCWREDGQMVFEIEDRGVGIPEDQQARVFERFESRSQGSRHRGAGLGLAIVKSLVDLHQGSVSLASEPGKGTKITVRFPERGSTRRALAEPVAHLDAEVDDQQSA